MEDGHSDGNEQFIACDLFGDRNMLGDMVANFDLSLGNAEWGIPSSNYIVNIISPLESLCAQSLRIEQMLEVFVVLIRFRNLNGIYQVLYVFLISLNCVEQCSNE